jgi:hypothetical protein
LPQFFYNLVIFPLVHPTDHGKYTFNIKRDEWLSVHDDIFDSSNWQKEAAGQ